MILEGPDGSGKTTLAQQLVSRYGFTRVHNGLYPEATGEDLLRRYTGQLVTALREDEDVVFDRSFLSEHVYGKVMRGTDRLGDLGRRLLTRLCQGQGVVEVICLPVWHTVKTNWFEKRKEEYDPVKRTGDYVDKLAKAREIWAIYAKLLMDHHQVHYDYENGKLLPAMIYKGRPEKIVPGLVGNPMGSCLIVGEQVNTKKAWVDLPFYSLTGVSAYLDEALRQAGIPERELAFVNAYSREGTPLSREYLRLLPNLRRVIFLGKRAAGQTELNKTLIGRTVHHPNYWMRFRRGPEDHLAQYAKLLRDAYAS